MSPTDGSLINLGDLAKPAITLIEKVSDAVGGIAKPWQIRRVAKAEATAELIKAQSRIEISELEQRALLRLVKDEGQKQQNIEDITEKAIPLLSADAKPEKVERDWFINFFEKGKLISDQEMQTLWAGILAGESNSPGSFSKRTVELVSNLDKSDANLFTKFSTFVWNIDGAVPIVPKYSESIFLTSGLHFSALTHLDSIGLINFNSMMSFRIQNLPKRILIHYYGCPVILEFQTEEKNTLPLGNTLLTNAGKQLCLLCGSKPSSDYFDYVLEHWINSNLIISAPFDARAEYVAIGS